MRQKAHGIWSETTWGEAWDTTVLAANGLMAFGVEPGDRVTIHSENRREWLILDLATVAVRATTVGLHPTNPEAETQHTLDDCAPVVHLAEDQEQVDKVLERPEGTFASLKKVIYVELRGLAEYNDPRLIHWDEFLELGRKYQQENPDALDTRMAAAQADDVMTVVYTAGATGPPKGAMLTNANCTFAIDALVSSKERMPGGKLPNGDDQILTFLPLCDVAERVFSTWHLVSTSAVLNFAKSDDQVTAALWEVQPTLFFVVPRMWEKLHAGVLLRAADASKFKSFMLQRSLRVAQWIGRERVANGGKWTVPTRLAYAVGWPLVFRPLRERLGLRHCRYAASGTAPIAPEVLAFFIGIGLNVFEIYGTTENTAVATANLDGRLKLGTIGEPYPGLADSVRLDETTQEIQLKHAGVFAGYWGNPESSAAALTSDGWLKTGDLGEWDGTHLRFVEREQHMLVTSDGTSVSPSAIENSLKTSPFIDEAMVVGNRRDYLTALISIQMGTVGPWARKQGIPFTTYRDLTDREEVRQLVEQAVDQTNERVGQAGVIKEFRLIPKELDHEDGELTATSKVKRTSVEDVYGELVESMY